MLIKGNMTIFFSEKDLFSNWFISEFEVKGVRFNCVEQFMMFAKAKLFRDESTAQQILAAPHPREQKALGRKVANYDDAVWCERRGRIVAHGCYAKFSQNPQLRDALLATAGTILVEASPYDRIWGVGLHVACCLRVRRYRVDVRVVRLYPLEMGVPPRSSGGRAYRCRKRHHLLPRPPGGT